MRALRETIRTRAEKKRSMTGVWRLPHASAKAAVVSIDLKFFRGASTLHWAAYHMENYAEI